MECRASFLIILCNTNIRKLSARVVQWSLTMWECLFEPKNLIRTYVYFFYEIITAWWEERCRKENLSRHSVQNQGTLRWQLPEASSPFFRGDVSDASTSGVGLDVGAGVPVEEGDSVAEGK